jgi:hypothetical protein
MTEEDTPPDAGEPAEDPTPDSPDTPDAVESSEGISLATGVVWGVIVGVLGAIVAALFFGSGGSIATIDNLDAPDAASSSAGSQPGEPRFPQPASGTDILPPARTGGGALILENTGAVDAVVVLADERSYSRAVYVRSGERVTVPNVAAGTYEVLMMLGLEWNASRFTQSPIYQQLDQAIEFAERDVVASTEYTRLTVSIEPVAAGVTGVRQTAPFQLLAP